MTKSKNFGRFFCSESIQNVSKRTGTNEVSGTSDRYKDCAKGLQKMFFDFGLEKFENGQK